MNQEYNTNNSTSPLQTALALSQYMGRYKGRYIGRSLARQSALLPSLLLTFLFAFSQAAVAQDQPQPKLPTVTLSMAGKSLITEIANTPNQRYMGLSFRQQLAENEAMLFVYQAEEALIFTMRNTLLPLSIAYISEDFIIQEIQQMPVGPNQYFPAKAPAKFALEVNQGWFKRNGVTIGTQITMK